jgi:hypothetical protein
MERMVKKMKKEKSIQGNKNKERKKRMNNRKIFNRKK